MTTDSRPRLRWARAQRFRLSVQGVEAQRALTDALGTAQGQGRAAFDAARSEWAKTHLVQPDDSVVLAELKASDAARLDDVMALLDNTGNSREQVKQSIEQLYAADLIDPMMGQA